jgi:hypothetical protein
VTAHFRLGTLGAAWVLLQLSACRPADVPLAPRVLRHELTRPDNAAEIYLNEDLLFHFSGEIDRASVTRASVSIRSKAGREARGALQVEGRRLRFVPAPVLSSTLDDGGYLPGTEYEVEIAGFPRPDGLRGVHGEPLASTYRWSFRTVAPRGDRAQLLFDDRAPDKTRLLRPYPALTAGDGFVQEVEPEDSLYLKCDKPLDPSTFDDAHFALISRIGERVPVRGRLIENASEPRLLSRPERVHSSASDAAWEREPRAALIELAPFSRLKPGMEYQLRFDERIPRLQPLHVWVGGPLVALGWSVLGESVRVPCDFGGSSVWDPNLALLRVRVRERGDSQRRGLLREEFLDTRLRSPVAVPGADGTAAWHGTGRVEVRFPRAAGDGHDGTLELGDEESRRDVHAVRLSLAAGRECQLSAPPGPLVLRAQGKLSIAGRLVRRSGAFVPMPFDALTEQEWRERKRAAQPLSRWVDGLLAEDPATAAHASNWTLIIAGGDLVIDGEIDVSTPLFLCAGGMIRVGGTVRAGREDQAFRLGAGGGEGVSAANVYELEIDPPLSNPLRESLVFAVLSGPIPPRGGVAEWLLDEAGGSASSDDNRDAGRFSVRYLKELSGTPRTRADLVLVDHPRLFEHAGPLQFLIELTLEPGERWNPPFVDYVNLTWEEDRRAGKKSGE